MLFALRGVTASRAGRAVLRGVDLDLEPGRDGGRRRRPGPASRRCCACSTGSPTPTSGEIRFRDRPLRELDVLALRREVALVPQLPALLEGTVADNVAFGSAAGGPRSRHRPRAALAGLDAGFADRDGAGLSVGEQQRVMLARALALEPRVLLLDEPTAALDARTRDAIERTLAELRERLDLSLVLVTHDPAQARRLGDRIVTVDEGRVA